MEKIASFYVNVNELDSAIQATHSCNVSFFASASSMKIYFLDLLVERYLSCV